MLEITTEQWFWILGGNVLSGVFLLASGMWFGKWLDRRDNDER